MRYCSQTPRMKTKLKRIPLVIAIASIGVMMMQYSSSPPIDRTNRIGSNCTGCHSGTLNSGSGSISLSGFSSYYPGSSYTLNLSVSGGTIHGFQVTSVRSGATNTGAGSFSGSGYNTSTVGGRSYARHSSTSTSGNWNITWSAPSSGVGSVVFYAAGVAANNNGGTSGDQVYATTYTVTQLPLINYSFGKTDPSCAGASDASAFVTGISGGSGGPYTITWPTGTSTSGDTAVSLSSGNYSVTVTDASGNEEVKSVTINQATGPSIANSVRGAACGTNHGQVSLTVTGAVTPLTYVWRNYPSVSSNVLDSVPAGNYFVEVTDANGCTDSATINVPQTGTLLQAFTSDGPEYCAASNGFINLDSLSGNFGPVDLLWSNGDTTNTISQLSASNSYSLTITDSAGCSESFTYQVQSISNTINASVSTNPDFCAGGVGSAQISNLSGGLGSYTYLWSTGDTTMMLDSLFAGAISVTVTDSVMCSATFTDSVSSSGTPVLAMNSFSLDCYGDQNGVLNVNAINGIEPYSYQWSASALDTNEINGLSAGSYKVTVTDSAGCFDTISSLVSQPDSLQLDSFTTVDSRPDLCEGKVMVSVSGGTSGYTYLWNDSNATTTDSLVNVCPGTYVLDLTDANACLKQYSFEIESLPIPSSARILDKSSFQFVRTNQELMMKTKNSEEFSYELYNLAGQLLVRGRSKQGTSRFDLQSIQPVLIRVENEEGVLLKKVF